MTESEQETLMFGVGAVWRSKRRGETYRTVTITERRGERVFVTRNTSRRTQSISLRTLTKDYRWVRGGRG